MSLPLLHAGKSAPGLSAALDLRFALDKSLTAYRGPTPSFSRASTGSYFDGSGVLRYAPVNLVQYSEQFNDAYWTKDNCSISINALLAPDGKLTADKVVENSLNNAHYVFRATSYSSGIYTKSVYMKAGERNWGWVYLESGASALAYFNLENGTVGNVTGTLSPSANITNIGNGWYRCSITANVPTNNFATGFGTSTSNGVLSYLGNGTSGIYIWGAQLETGSTVGTYCPTTSSANSAPRFNHTFNGTSWVSRGLLVEEQRTNSLQYSESFNTSPYWAAAGGATITANQAVAPDGNTTADNVAGVNGFYQNSAGMGSSTATNTASIFAKANGSSSITLRINEWGSGINYVEGTFNLSNGTATATNGGSGSGATASMIDCGNGWYRCIITGKPSTTAGTCGFYPYGMTTSVYCWGAQFEAGASFATSYIPSLSNSSTTRSADVCQITGSDFSGFWNGTEGTFAVECDRISFPSTTSFAFEAYSDASNKILLENDSSADYSSVRNGGVDVVSWVISPAVQPNVSNKSALAYKANDFAWSRLGATPVTDTSGGVPYCNALAIGNRGAYGALYALNGHIARLRYFNKRLPNATLQLLSEPDPTLNLQFALNKTLTPVAGPAPSFSRASTGTYFNASGVLTSASINTPRFDHVFSGGQWVSRGLLLEEQRTNIQLRSEDFGNVKWVKLETTATAASAIAPDGNNTAYLLTESNNNAVHSIYWDALPCSSGVTYTLSFFVKASGRNFCNVRLGQVSGESCYFDLANGTVGTADAGVTGRIQNVGNGWYRCSATKSSGFTTIYPSVSPSIDGTAISYQGDSSKGIYIWGASLEQGTFPTSHISTTSSSVTRSADVCQITGTSFNWMWNQGEGSVVAEYDRLANNSSGLSGGYPTTFSASSSNSLWMVLAGSIAPSPVGEVLAVYDTTSQAYFAAGSSPLAGIVAKMSACYKANDFAASLDGSAVSTDTSGTVPVCNQIGIGYWPYGNAPVNGHIAKLIYYPARLTNAKLQQLST